VKTPKNRSSGPLFDSDIGVVTMHSLTWRSPVVPFVVMPSHEQLVHSSYTVPGKRSQDQFQGAWSNADSTPAIGGCAVCRREHSVARARRRQAIRVLPSRRHDGSHITVNRSPLLPAVLFPEPSLYFARGQGPVVAGRAMPSPRTGPLIPAYEN